MRLWELWNKHLRNPRKKWKCAKAFDEHAAAVRTMQIAYGTVWALVLSEIKYAQLLWQYKTLRAKVMVLLMKWENISVQDEQRPWEENSGRERSLEDRDHAANVRGLSNPVVATNIPTQETPVHPSNVKFDHEQQSFDFGQLPNEQYSRLKRPLDASPGETAVKRHCQDSNDDEVDAGSHDAVTPSVAQGLVLKVKSGFEQRSREDKTPGRRSRAPNHMAQILNPPERGSSPAGLHTEDRGSNLEDRGSKKQHLQHNAAYKSRANMGALELNPFHPLITLIWNRVDEARPEVTYLMQLDQGQGTNDRIIVYSIDGFWSLKWVDEYSMYDYDPAICSHDLQRSRLDELGFADLARSIKRSDTWQREVAEEAGDRTQCFKLFFPAAGGQSRESYGGSCLLMCIVSGRDAPQRLRLVRS
jgi:hypothetical protein